MSIALDGELYRNVDADFLKNKLAYIQKREKKVTKIELWKRRLKDVKEARKKITNNFGLKVLAAVLAVVLWVIVAGIDDPVITQTYTTSVTLENVNYLTENGKYSELLGGNNTVTFSVSAKRSYHERLSNSDFYRSCGHRKNRGYR